MSYHVFSTGAHGDFPARLPNPAVIERKHPPIGIMDTVRMTKDADGSCHISSVHPPIIVFHDDEIVNIHTVLRRERIAPNVFAEYTGNRKAIIQQQAQRGCTAAAVAMLVKDDRRDPDVQYLGTTNLGNTDEMMAHLRAAGLTPVLRRSETLQDLRDKLLDMGSAIVTIDDLEIGGHTVVVDKIPSGLYEVRLRDPYHGWEITVTADSFMRRWDKETIIQVEPFPV